MTSRTKMKQNKQVLNAALGEPTPMQEKAPITFNRKEAKVLVFGSAVF